MTGILCIQLDKHLPIVIAEDVCASSQAAAIYSQDFKGITRGCECFNSHWQTVSHQHMHVGDQATAMHTLGSSQSQRE